MTSISTALVTGEAGAFTFPGAPEGLLTIHAAHRIGQTIRCDDICLHRRLEPGDIDFLPAGAPVELEDEGPNQILALLLPRDLEDEALESLGVRPPALKPLFGRRDARLAGLAWALHSAPAGESLYRDCLGLELARAVLWQRLPPARLEPAPTRSLSGRHARRLIDMIESNLDRSLSLRDLAAETGLGATAFKAAFRATFGVPVHRFVVHRRAERARLMLLAGDTSASQIALETGFSHQTHMGRWLRRLFGLGPSEFTAHAV